MIDPDYRYKFYTNNLFYNHNTYRFIVDKKYTKYSRNEPVLFSKDHSHKDILNQDIPLYIVICNDGYINKNNLPCFQKIRTIVDHSEFSILAKIEPGRHWGAVYNLRDKINWTDKQSNIVWRGAPTGNGDRIKFCLMYNEVYDVGLSSVFNSNQQYAHLVKNPIDFDNFTKYKYIVSIEGNDKDSGLNWKLSSGSVVMMRKPKLDSWLMESHLIPWVHYVPINDDFSDLTEKYKWCLSNDDKCKDISYNANRFIDMFRDLEAEKYIISRIESDYKKYIKIEIK